LARRGCHTASNFGSVLKAKGVTSSLLKRLLGEYDLLRVKAVKWGVKNEEEAIKAFTLKTGKTVKEKLESGFIPLVFLVLPPMGSLTMKLFLSAHTLKET